MPYNYDDLYREFLANWEGKDDFLLRALQFAMTNDDGDFDQYMMPRLAKAFRDAHFQGKSEKTLFQEWFENFRGLLEDRVVDLAELQSLFPKKKFSISPDPYYGEYYRKDEWFHIESISLVDRYPRDEEDRKLDHVYLIIAPAFEKKQSSWDRSPYYWAEIVVTGNAHLFDQFFAALDLSVCGLDFYLTRWTCAAFPEVENVRNTLLSYFYPEFFGRDSDEDEGDDYED